MLKIEGTTIRLTRGDTARLDLTISDTTGKGYTFQQGDAVVLTVKTSADAVDEALLKLEYIDMEKTLVEILLKPEDTKDLSFDTYWYDVELRTAAGEIYTVVSYSKFVICKEVTL